MREGTRLVPTGLIASDFELALGMFDKTLGFTCEFETELAVTPSAAIYCLPARQSWFSDSQCTTPVVLASSCSAPPTYVSVQKDCVLDSVRQVETATELGTNVYRWYNGACHAAGGPYATYALGDPLPMSTFVAETRTSAGDGRVRALTYTGADGSLFTQPFYADDTTLDTICEASVASDKQLRCAPLTVAFTQARTFADNQCTQAVAGVSDTCAPAQSFSAAIAVVEDDAACTTYPTYDTVGATTTSVWNENAAMCTSGAGAGGGYASYVEVTGSLAVSALAPFTRTRIPIDARLSIYANQADGVNSFGDYLFHDSTLDVDCQQIEADDSVVRCLPADNSLGEVVYTDAQCTAPVYQVDTGHCSQVPQYALTSDANAACGGNIITRVGARVAAPAQIFYLGDDRSCTSIDPFESAAFYSLGEVVPPSSFEAITNGRFDGAR